MINKVILLGRLGKDVTVRNISEKFWVAETTIATDDSYKKKDGGWENVTDWHNLTFTNPSQNLIDRLVSGAIIYLEGKSKEERWDDDKGNKRNITKIKVQIVRVMPNGRQQRGQNMNSGDGEDETNPPFTEDLPF